MVLSAYVKIEIKRSTSRTKTPVLKSFGVGISFNFFVNKVTHKKIL